MGKLRRAKVRSTGKAGRSSRPTCAGVRPGCGAASCARATAERGRDPARRRPLAACAPRGARARAGADPGSGDRTRAARPEPGHGTTVPLPRASRCVRTTSASTRFKHRSETTTIFVVDASGSSALHRLGEAKGAVELLLADCYVRRDRVALVAFRGKAAELLLPPTRSLVRAKRCLADLPGGGGTPLASGIEAGLALADAVKRRGGTPLLVLLTDGRANVARDGQGGRTQAGEEALTGARLVRPRASPPWWSTPPRIRSPRPGAGGGDGRHLYAAAPRGCRAPERGRQGEGRVVRPGGGLRGSAAAGSRHEHLPHSCPLVLH